MTFKFCKIALMSAAGLIAFSATPALAGPTADCVDGSGPGTTECGSGSDTSPFAVDNGESTAIGNQARTNGSFSTVVGFGAQSDARAVTVGASSYADTGSVAVGSGTVAADVDTIAIGAGATIPDTGPAIANAGAIAIGVNSSSSGGGAISFGFESQTNGFGAVALGLGSNASAENSVALGANSVADQANTVSVGSVSSERKIVNVAAGVDDTDAVNMSQLNTTNQTVAAQGTQIAANAVQIAANTSSIATQSGQISTLQTVAGDHENRIAALEQLDASFDLLGVRLDSLELRNLKQDKAIRRANEGVAMAMAMDTPVLLPGERIAVTGGLGFWNDRVAGAASMGFRVTDHTSMSIGVGIAPKSGKAGGKVGFRMGW